jgi:hypothetical protein
MKHLWKIGAIVLVLVLAACSSASQATEPAASPQETAPDTTGAEVVPAAGRLQLVEFYADW